MNTATLKMGFIFLFLVLEGGGCEDNNQDLWEISPNSKSAVIQQEVDGIEFKFCLLNEEGEPTTVFNEAENFTFYFSVTNKRDEKLYFDPGFAYIKGNDFCKVFDSNNQELGKPFIFLGYDKIGTGAYLFARGQSYVFEQQWMDNRNSTWRWQYGYYESNTQEYLAKGNYNTTFKYRFRFAHAHDELSLDTDTLSFKINFKIQ